MGLISTSGYNMQFSRQPLTRVVISSTAFLLTACSGLHATYVPDGRRGFVVNCGGFLNSWSSCLIKAGRACGNRGYETVKGNEEDRSMMIACKVPNIADTRQKPP
jgi:hypothetical protein